MTDAEFDKQYYAEMEANRLARMADHQSAFNAWLPKQNLKLVDSAEGFNVGDKVTFTNDNGVVFTGHTIMAIDANEEGFYGRRMFLDYDCYWFPAHSKNLTKEVLKPQE